MNMQKVEGPSFRFVCWSCGGYGQLGDRYGNMDGNHFSGTVYADLDGPAFKAYYHVECLFEHKGVLIPKYAHREIEA
jgi:hypothetical protein